MHTFTQSWNSDLSLLGSIIEAYMPRLRRFVGARAPVADIDDIVQETFVRVLLHVSGLRDKDRFEPWLFAVCRNCIATHLGRAKRRREELIDPDMFQAPKKDSLLHPLTLRSLLYRIDEDKRIYLELKYLCGFSYRSIATLLGIREERVKSRLFEYRKIIRESVPDEASAPAIARAQSDMEDIVKKRDDIQLGARVVTRLSQAAQLRLLDCVRENSRFSDTILQELREADEGVEFVRRFDGVLSLWEFAEVLCRMDDATAERIQSTIDSDSEFSGSLQREVSVADLENIEHSGLSLISKTDREYADVITISISGYIDEYNSQEFLEKVLNIVESGIKSIVFDCSEFRYISATGIGALVAIVEALEQKCGRLAICNLDPAIFHVFELLGIDGFVTVTQELHDGLEYVSAANEGDSSLMGLEGESTLIPTGFGGDNAVFFCGYLCRPERASGDFFDYRKIDEHTWAIIHAEVSGTGVATRSIAAQIAADFHMFFEHSDAGSDALEDLLYLMNDHILALGFSARFACIRLLTVRPASGECSIANAGSIDQPVYRRGTGNVEHIKLEKSISAGMFSNELIRERRRFHTDRLQLKPGDALLLLSDGIEESQSPEGEEFGVDRIDEVFASRLASSGGLSEAVDAVISAEKRHRGDHPQAHDISFLGIQLRQ